MNFFPKIAKYFRGLGKRKVANPIIIHLHVPKTAGSSINRLLTNHYGGRALVCDHPESLAEFMGMPVEDRDRNYDAAFGHIVWGWHGYFSRPAQYFSATRDVVDRITSYFNYIHVTESHGYHHLLKEKLVSLDQISLDFLDSHPDLKASWANAFCHHYAARRIETLEDYRELERRLIEDMKARRFVCGSLRRIEAFLRTLGIAEGPLPRENVTEHALFQDYSVASRDTISPKTIRLLREINQFDLRLLDAVADYEARNRL